MMSKVLRNAALWAVCHRPEGGVTPGVQLKLDSVLDKF
jgi:hypothetical protein